MQASDGVNMVSVLKSDPLHLAIKELQVALERQTVMLAALETRLGVLHEDVRRSAETMTRLKLAADNAKQLSQAHQEALTAIDKRLAGVETRYDDGE